jgi:soluble lytic murein transglycosylase-like protein
MALGFPRRKNILHLSASLALCISSPVLAGKKNLTPICEQHISDAAVAQGVPLGILYAVALTETGAGGQLNPYALNIEGESFLAKSHSEAVAAFHAARKEDKILIDLGCMQINHFYHKSQFQSVEAMLDPRTNIHYAAKLLKTLKIQHGNWTDAISYYHASAKKRVAQRRYVCKVLKNMVATDFGVWTPAAEQYCKTKDQAALISLPQVP